MLARSVYSASGLGGAGAGPEIGHQLVAGRAQSTGDVDLVGPGGGAPGDVGPLGGTAGRGGGIDRAQVAGEPLKRDALGIGQLAVVGQEGHPFVEIDLGPVDLLGAQ